MNNTIFKFQKIRMRALLFLLFSSMQLTAISSNMTHRVMSSSPLLYKMIDYSKDEICFEIEPIYTGMYDAKHTISNLTPLGKQTLNFDQQGNGDMNPVWLNLMSNNSLANYHSDVTFTPSLSQSGALFHWYDSFDDKFIEIKTALVQCKSQIAIAEVGGGNGLNPGILNAQQAFTQTSWNYGKIGQANHVVGLDNIELRFGKISKATSNASTYDLFIAAFGLIEAPTGTGTKAEWLFEPQVGTNHWGLGFGFEALVNGDDDIEFMIAGNYRYLTPAWETRSFDLVGNGPWSRYLAVQDTYGLPTAPTTLGLPGINFFTQQAYINGRSELNLYARLSKQFRSSYFELSYNLLCVQKETIGNIQNLTSGYGIYALTGPAGGSGGVTTSSSATINQATTALDPIGAPIVITTQDFDKLSATAQAYATNSIAARVDIMHSENIIYGFGAAVESALSASALSTWSVWAKFEYSFDSVNSSEDLANEFTPNLYEYDADNNSIDYNNIEMDNAGLPQDVIQSIEQEFMNDTDHIESFEFLDNDEFQEEVDEINEQELQLILSEHQIDELHQQLTTQENKTAEQIHNDMQELPTTPTANQEPQISDIQLPKNNVEEESLPNINTADEQSKQIEEQPTPTEIKAEVKTEPQLPNTQTTKNQPATIEIPEETVQPQESTENQLNPTSVVENRSEEQAALESEEKAQNEDNENSSNQTKTIEVPAQATTPQVTAEEVITDIATPQTPAQENNVIENQPTEEEISALVEEKTITPDNSTKIPSDNQSNNQNENDSDMQQVAENNHDEQKQQATIESSTTSEDKTVTEEKSQQATPPADENNEIDQQEKTGIDNVPAEDIDQHEQVEEKNNDEEKVVEAQVDDQDQQTATPVEENANIETSVQDENGTTEENNNEDDNDNDNQTNLQQNDNSSISLDDDDHNNIHQGGGGLLLVNTTKQNAIASTAKQGIKEEPKTSAPKEEKNNDNQKEVHTLTEEQILNMLDSSK